MPTPVCHPHLLSFLVKVELGHHSPQGVLGAPEKSANCLKNDFLHTEFCSSRRTFFTHLVEALMLGEKGGSPEHVLTQTLFLEASLLKGIVWGVFDSQRWA